MILIERGDRHEIIVVGATPKLQVGDRRLTAFGERDQMVELEKPAFIAAALWPDERALPLITCPDLSFHRRRHVTTRRLRFVPIPGVIGARQLPLLNFPKQDRERPVEDFGDIAVRHYMSHEVLECSQLAVRFGSDGELHLVTFECERSDDGRHGGAAGFTALGR